jgi:hypothetical protein
MQSDSSYSDECPSSVLSLSDKDSINSNNNNSDHESTISSMPHEMFNISSDEDEDVMSVMNGGIESDSIDIDVYDSSVSSVVTINSRNNIDGEIVSSSCSSSDDEY